MNRKLPIVLTILAAVAISATCQIFRTNQMSSAQALRIASRLALGMGENETYDFMETNEFTAGYTIGSRVGGTRFYLLSDGCRLDLEINVKSTSWTRVLTGACLRSNDVKITSIVLTNGP